MKPFTLHLTLILFVVSQLTLAIVQSTTDRPPSLPSPTRSQITTTMTPSTSTSSIKLMAINNTRDIPHKDHKISSITTNKRSLARDHSEGKESNEDSPTITRRYDTGERSIVTANKLNGTHRQLYQPNRLPIPTYSPLRPVQVQPNQKYQQQRQSESLTSRSTNLPTMNTAKTPRMIQRAVGGHIQNVPQSIATTTVNPLNMPPYRRNLYRFNSAHRSVSPTLSRTTSSTSTSTPVDPEDWDDYNDNNDDDAAFLDDPGDLDNWDNGILRLSAGSGKEASTKTKKKDETKKTLSDQVKDGKYGLIEKEIFQQKPKRPGIISYLPNKEVPIDNDRNYGGLDEDDIWLAEDHLLVLKGGNLNKAESSEPWPPLDDYDAPDRQIKIPPTPKVPPPFPVQLEENGPIQFIGNSKVSLVYPIANESVSLYTGGQETPIESSKTDHNNEKNLLTGPGTSGGTEKGQNNPKYFYPKPYPSWLFHNQSFVNPFLGSRPVGLPGLNPFLNGSLDMYNNTEFDEDDPSLYYPPPYSFIYKNNYSNPVPPGPLVPGIVLPPPPDAFARLDVPKTRGTPRKPIKTTSVPFEDILSKISEYNTKTFKPPTTPLPPTPQISKATPSSVWKNDPKRVSNLEPPYKVYPSTPKQNLISYIPANYQEHNTDAPTLSKSNPIYYEYFDARKESSSTGYLPGPLQTQSKLPSAPKSNGQHLYSTSTTTERPAGKQQYYKNREPQYPYEDFLYITPKPEIHPNGVPNVHENFIPYEAPVKVPPLKNNRPYESFEQEVNAIRETLRYYENQQLQDNNIPRARKTKPIYDPTYERSKPTDRNFSPPEEYDAEPFKPMVTYSPAVDDVNAFRAIAFEKIDDHSSGVRNTAEATSSTASPPARQQKKFRVDAKYLPPLITPYDQTQPLRGPQLHFNPSTTPTPILSTQHPWVTVEKQAVHEVKSARLQMPSNHDFPGYHYNIPNRQNNRYFDTPYYQQQAPSRKVINRRPTQRPQPQKQQPWSLENDTYVNYAPNRPPLNPQAEFIRPQQQYPSNQYSRLQANHPQRVPPARIINQNPYFGQAQPPIRTPNRQQPQVSLHRDTLVNYRFPLPPINPDSEYIQIPSLTHQQHQQSNYHPPVAIQYQNPSQNGNVFYQPQHYRRHANAANEPYSHN